MNKILVLIFSFIAFFAQAQTVTVLNKSNGNPIESVYVFNASKSKTATTDNNGLVDLSSFENDESVYFTHTSFESEYYSKDEIQALGDLIFLIEKSLEMEEFIVSASKSKERLSEISNQVEIITTKESKLQNPQTTANLLNNNGKVYIQKSQMGGGSPIIRGFEANKVLLVVDGVRMNNAIYRGGHLQNVITLDPSIIERTEVIFGPNSLIYGSDALGGVMHFITKDPKLTKGISNINAMLRTASANSEKSFHIDANLGWSNVGVLTSLSFSDFGNLKMGKKRLHGNESWGKRDFYIGINDEGVETMLPNENNHELVPTGYRQFDVLQKWKFVVSEKQSLTANLQFSTSSNIPRFDRYNDYAEVPTNTSRGLLKFAQWDYGPQNRFLASLKHKISSNNAPLFDQITTTLAYQKIDEDRIKRKTKSDKITHNQEDVFVYSLNVDASKLVNNKNQFYYGLEANHNNVKSNAFNQSFATGEISDEFVLSRYADDKNQMSTYAIYLKHKIKFNDKLNITDGLRFSVINLSSAFSENVSDLNVKSFDENFSALTGGIGLNFKATQHTKLSVNMGTGFRAPNIDDTGKFFDPQDGIVVVPNFEVKPEYLINADIGFRHKITDKVVLNLNAFYNYIFNAIVRRDYILNDKTSLVFDETESVIFANKNAGEAQVYGFAADLKINFNSALSGFANYNYIKGRDITEDVPLGHIPPIYGMAGINFDKNKWQSKLFVQYNDTKPFEEYSPSGEDKESEALPTSFDTDGTILTYETPKWMTTNFNLGYQINDIFYLSASVENIFDIHYIPFASGISGFGRNFVFAVRSSF